MTTYEFHSEKYNCNIQVIYSGKKILIGFQILNEDGVNVEELAKLLSSLLHEDAFLKVAKSKNIKVVKLATDLSFQKFWNDYGYKEGGSKKKAEAIWEKLSEKDKSAALSYIARYKQVKQVQGTAMAYATTYLNGQPWNN